MRITMNARNMQLSDSLDAVLQKKIRKLERYFREDTPVYVTLSVQRNWQTVEMTIPYANNVLLRAEETTDDMYTSIDGVLEKLEKQILKHRTKLEKRFREGAFDSYDAPVFADHFEEPADEIRIERVKRFGIAPMSPEEAVLQMELLGHTFFMFINPENGRANVVYKRKDGQYGLLDPDYD